MPKPTFHIARSQPAQRITAGVRACTTQDPPAGKHRVSSLSSLARAAPAGGDIIMLAEVAGFFHGDPHADRPEWRHIVHGSSAIAVAYRVSSFGYSIAGVLLMMYAERLQRFDAGFWWYALGMALFAQGVISYMSDVYSWGRQHSIWRAIDPKMASILFIFFGPCLGSRAALGYFQVPPSTIAIWLLSCVGALVCKAMGARASRSKGSSCEELMLWHTGWHVLPFVAAFCILDLAFVWTFTEG